MTNKIITADIKPGSRIRTGVPNDEPVEALQALCRHLSSRPAVVAARLGLMEVFDEEDTPGFFTYTVGITCESDSQCESEMDMAMKAIVNSPTGRWPISFLPPSSTYFTPESRVFYQRKPVAKPGLLARLFKTKP